MYIASSTLKKSDKFPWGVADVCLEEGQTGLSGGLVPGKGVEPALEEGGVRETGVVVDELEHKQLETVALLVFGLCPEMQNVWTLFDVAVRVF